MEYHFETGESVMDCKLKIAAKYQKPFTIMGHKEIRMGGVLGFFTKPGVEVQWYFNPPPRRKFIQETEEEFEARKKKLLETANSTVNYDKSLTGAAIAGKDASDQILSALKDLKEKIENKDKDEHPSFTKISQILKMNDFSEKFIGSIHDRMSRELSLEKLSDFNIVQDHVLEWIGESISIYKEDEFPSKPRVVVLIGPTGVGKTSTIAKLAAFYGIKREDFNAYDVRMLTIDHIRICAFEQLERIAAIMRIPVTKINAESALQTKDMLRREIALNRDIDMFLIDTFGNNPKDASKIGEMKTILDGAGKYAEYHLTVSAATKTSDLDNIFRQFEPFNYKSIILTKMDETEHVGNIISILAEKRKSISFITDGQGIPSDIKKAAVIDFLTSLDGFKINRDKLEKRFPAGDAGQFRWK